MMKNIKHILWTFLFCCCAMTAAAQTYRVGDLYTAPDGSRGVVFYVFPDGSGGWVVALNDVSASCKWGNDTDILDLEDQLGTYAQRLLADTSGYTNTAIIRNQQHNSSYAAGVVDFAHGWYLPSPGQLRMIHAKMPLIDSSIIRAGGSIMAKDWYWCSAEQNSWMAWRIDFGNSVYHGQFNVTSKTDRCHVRAVRSFTYEPTYVWSTGDTGSTVTVAPQQSTEYTVSASTPAGCVGESTYQLRMDGVQGLDVLVSHDTICAGDSITVQAMVGNAAELLTPWVPPIAVGDVLCTDGTFEKPSAWPVEGKTAKGVVFYVDNTGQHGWAVALEDVSTSIKWSTLIVDLPDLVNYTNARSAVSDMNGYDNTVVARAAGNADTYPAVYAVDFENGWYVPAIGQIRNLYAEIMNVNATLSILNGMELPMTSGFTYWSSTESTYMEMWILISSGVLDGDGYKRNPTRLRSICDF